MSKLKLFSSPTRAIKNNAARLLIIVTLCSILLMIYGLVLRLFELNQIHECIGIYGLKVAQVNGMNIDGILGSWWNGYEILETMIQKDFGLICGFGVGMTMAIMPLALMYSYVKQAIHRIEFLEKQIGDEEPKKEVSSDVQKESC